MLASKSRGGKCLRTLQAIDEEAAAHGLTRSAFIASAALEKIRRGT